MSESDSRDKKFVTSLVQGESGEWREMERRGKNPEKRRGYVPSPSPNPAQFVPTM